MMTGLYWTGLCWSVLECTEQDWSDIWSDLIWSDLVWSDLIWSDLIWSDLIWSDLIWSDLIWSDLIWSDLYWSGVEWSGGSGVELSGVGWTAWTGLIYTLDWTGRECGLCYMVLCTAPSTVLQRHISQVQLFLSLSAVASHNIKYSACATISPTVSQITLMHTLCSMIFPERKLGEGGGLSKPYLRATFAADDTIDIPFRFSNCDCGCDSNEIWLI